MSEVVIPLTRGQKSVVDAADAEMLLARSWQALPRRDGHGYYASSKGSVLMHRVIMQPAKGLIVDHINGDSLDNRRCNLRVGTRSQNCVNRQVTPGKCLRGVQKEGNRWRAAIRYSGKTRHLGTYDTEFEAHQAYLAEARRLHGDWLPVQFR